MCCFRCASLSLFIIWTWATLLSSVQSLGVFNILLIWPSVWKQKFIVSGTVGKSLGVEGESGRSRGDIFWMFTLRSHMRVLLGPCSPSLTGQFYLSIYLFKWLIDLFSRRAAGLAASRCDGTAVESRCEFVTLRFFFFFFKCAIDSVDVSYVSRN